MYCPHPVKVHIWVMLLIGCKLNFSTFGVLIKVVDSESFNSYSLGFWASEVKGLFHYYIVGIIPRLQSPGLDLHICLHRHTYIHTRMHTYIHIHTTTGSCCSSFLASKKPHRAMKLMRLATSCAVAGSPRIQGTRFLA